MSQKKKNTFRICIALDRSIKANRDKYSGILRYAATSGNWEIRTLNPCDQLFDARCNELFSTWIPNGLIGCSNLDCVAQALRKLHPMARPKMAHIDGTPDLNSADVIVHVDNAAIARRAAERLLACEYHSYAYIGTHTKGELEPSEERRLAFLSVFKKRGFSTSWFAPCNESGDSGDDIGRMVKWLQDLEKPCGIMTYYDETARLVFDACRLAHVRIPEEIALIGVDNDLTICENMDPTLTSVMPDFEGAGYLAARLLDRALHDKHRKRLIRAKYSVKALVERLSTQNTFKNGRLVAIAREVIRLHCHEGICVRDVVAQTKVSARILEMRFKQILHHSISEEIQCERLSRLLDLLKTTDRPTGELAYECGYRSSANAPTLFKKRMGMTMSEYRRRTTHSIPISASALS